MPNKKKPETVILIVIDSVRYYRTGVDDRDRVDLMDGFFKKDAVEFTNCYTSAPSSVMSAAAMYTGMDSCFLARNYNDWEFDNKAVVSLQQVLKEAGYEIYSIDNSRVGREVKRDLTMPLNKRFYPKGISHGNFWTNIELTSILKNVLEIGVSKKSFFMLWYDCREDPNTSYAVESALNLFKDFGLYDDALIFMNSDHGYPDPRSGLNKNTMRNMRHDMVVTDDNIKVPFFIKAPGVISREINDIVSLIDITPTVLDFLDIKKKDKRLLNISGISLKRKLYDDNFELPKNRIVRSDTRLLLQKGRITALISNKFKYVEYHDEKKSELFDMVNDPSEVNPLKLENFKIQVANFREILKEQQNRIDKFHISDLTQKMQELKKIILKNPFNSCIIASEAPRLIIDFFVSELKQIKPDLLIDFISHNKRNDIDGIFKNYFTINTVTKEKKYDISFIINEKSHFNFDNPIIYKTCRAVSRRSFNLDYNLKIYSRFMAKWVFPVLKYRKNWFFYKQEPRLIFADIWKLISIGIRIHLFKDKTKNPDMQIVKQLRDRAIIAKKENQQIQK